jgi:hypothetical protein
MCVPVTEIESPLPESTKLHYPKARAAPISASNLNANDKYCKLDKLFNYISVAKHTAQGNKLQARRTAPPDQAGSTTAREVERHIPVMTYTGAAKDQSWSSLRRPASAQYDDLKRSGRLR